jgi:hypothetical protein
MQVISTKIISKITRYLLKDIFNYEKNKVLKFNLIVKIN